MSGMIFKPSKKGSWKAKPAGTIGSSSESGLYVFGLLTLIFLSLAVLAFLRPLTRTAEPIQITQQGQFSYSATGTPIIYDTEVVRSGEPVFPRLTCFLNIDFAYNMSAPNVQDISGNYQLIARVMDAQTGWQRTIPMSGITTFTGNSFSTTSIVDLCQIVTLVQVLEQETGLRAGNYTLEVIPQVTVTANTTGIPVSESFEPKLTFKFDDVAFSLITPDGQDNPLRFSKQRSLPNPALETNTVSILGWTPSVFSLRVIAVFGLALSLGGLAISGICMYTATRQSPDSLIQLRYGSLLVNAHDQEIQATGAVIHVDNVNELAKLAERHNTVILHTTFNSLHSYFVQSNGTTYRYVDRPNKANHYELEPRTQTIAKPVYVVNSYDHLDPATDENELVGYILSRRTTEKAQVEETVVMRKIRL